MYNNKLRNIGQIIRNYTILGKNRAKLENIWKWHLSDHRVSLGQHDHYGKRDIIFGFKGSKPIGNDMSIFNLAAFEFLSLKVKYLF